MKLKTSTLNLPTATPTSPGAEPEKTRLTFAIIGAGHIGLPLAVRLAQTGAKVYGVTKTQPEADSINHAEPLFYEPGLTESLQQAIRNENLQALTNTEEATKRAETIIICVGTPVDKQQRPDLRAIRDVCRKVGKALSKGKLIILRSTVPPGFTEKTARKILENNSKLSAERDFGLAFCPERLVQGKAMQELVSVPQIVGGLNTESTEAAARIFETIGCSVVRVASPRVAEMAKLFDNIYRDVNIALANELALVCEAMKVDVMDVIQASNNGPRTRVLIPGSGTGGSCLNKDPYILLHEAHKAGVQPRLIPAARKVNMNMPHQTVKHVGQALDKVGKSVKGSKIAVLGLSFKKDTDDLRDTIAKPVIKELNRLGAEITAYDPLVSPQVAHNHLGNVQVAASLQDAASKADCILILADHQEFEKMNIRALSKIVNHPATIVDGRQIIDPNEAARNQFLFSGIGRPILYNREM